MFETISSIQNARVKNLVRLREGSHRRRQRKFVIEGHRELRRAVESQWPLETLFFCEDLFKDAEAFELIEKCEDAGTEIIKMTPEAFAKSAYRQGPDGLLATAPQRERQLEDCPVSRTSLLVVLEGIEKPGNIGAIFRTANAAGADALILTDTVTDPYNPNVVRASQGAFFQTPFYQVKNGDLLAFLEAKDVKPILTSPKGQETLWRADLRGPVAIVLGSEDEGLTEAWLGKYPAYQLPMEGITDSLNVSVMAAISLFEAVRQRSAQDS